MKAPIANSGCGVRAPFMRSVIDAPLARGACTVHGTAWEPYQPLKYAAMQRDETRCMSGLVRLNMF